MIDSYIALGSNLLDPLAQLRSAAKALAVVPESRLAGISPCYQSDAVGLGGQPPYLNAVARLETALPPLALLDALQAIENSQGRKRTVRWGARTLDLDILLYGCQVIEEARLSVPHPRMFERNFVLYPLLDIAGTNLMLPDGRELGTLAATCPPGDLVQIKQTLASTTNTGTQQNAPEAQ